MIIKKKLIIPFALLLIIAISYAGVALMKVISADSGDKDTFYGTAEAEQIDISAEVSGRLKEVKVQEGQFIKEGDLLAIIDIPENRIKTEQSELTLGSAENELARIEEGNREEEINIQRALVKQGEAAYRQTEAIMKQTEAVLGQSEEALKSAQETYDLYKEKYYDARELFEKGAISLQDMDNAEHTMNNSAHALESAKHSLEGAEAQLAGSIAQADSARFQLDASKEKLGLLVAGATERSIEASKYSVRQAEKNLDMTKVVLDKSKVTAAKDGVIEMINFSEGEYVGTGSPLMTMIDRSELWVKIYVPEKALSGLETGKQVSVKCDFLKDKVINGRITYISPEAEFTPLNIVTKEDRMKLVFAVKVKILDNLDSIKPGMLLDVDIN